MMIDLREIHKTVLAEAVITIIKLYKESLEEEPGMSDHRKEQKKLNAFDDILANVQWYEDKEGAL